MIANYNKKKPKNQEVSKYIKKHLREKTNNRFCQCGNWINFLTDEEVKKMKVHQARFCSNRFCPMCAWRLSQKNAMMLDVMMQYIEEEHKKDFILLTLTAPNVLGEDLSEEINRYNDALKKLFKREEVIAISHGYGRKLEVTYNSKRNDYHPHFHVLIVVSKSYFKSRDYISQQKWLTLWRDVMQDETITQVDVRRAKKNIAGADGRNKIVNEIAKYAAKDSDYAYSQEVFDTFYKSLKGRQILTFNGLFKQAAKMYKEKELDHYKTKDETEYKWLIAYQWGGQAYTETNRREITEDEYKELKKIAIDENALG